MCVIKRLQGEGAVRAVGNATTKTAHEGMKTSEPLARERDREERVRDKETGRIMSGMDEGKGRDAGGAGGFRVREQHLAFSPRTWSFVRALHSAGSDTFSCCSAVVHITFSLRCMKCLVNSV